MEKYQKFAEIYSKNLNKYKIMDFLYTTPPIMVTWQAPRADKVSKIVLKVVQEDFGNTRKNHIDCICRSFPRIFFAINR